MKKITVIAIALLALVSCTNMAKAQDRKKDTIPVIILVTDTTKMNISFPFAMRAFSVREQHDNTEGVNDPYFSYGFKKQYYWQHIQYLDIQKKILPSKYIVWITK